MKAIKTSAISACIAVAGLLSACSSSEDLTSNLPDDYIINMVYPERNIQLTNEQWEFARANNAFAYDFFKRISDIDGNHSSFCSPLSVTYMLGMMQAGATGETRNQILNVMRMNGSTPETVNNYCAKLMKEMPGLDEKVTLDMANSIYVNNRIGTIRETYTTDLNRYYDADVDNLDFTNPATLEVINGWCNNKTHGMIPKILDEINKNCVMYLLNAIYFKADWTRKFEKKYTHEEAFTTPSGATKEMPMMHQRVRAVYGNCSDYTTLELPYGNGAFSMTLLLPKEGKTTADILKRMDYDLSPKFCSTGEDYRTSTCDVDVKIPRFDTATEMDKLPKILSAMGMPLAFDPDLAQFTEMVNEGTLYVSMMKQKAKIEVNEEGSEAAAVTIGGFEFTSVNHEEPVYEKREFHANHPFVYLIRERGTGIVLFLGKYTGE